MLSLGACVFVCECVCGYVRRSLLMFAQVNAQLISNHVDFRFSFDSVGQTRDLG